MPTPFRVCFTVVTVGAAIALVGMCPLPMSAQEVTLSGQVRPRYFSADALDLHQGYLRYRGEDWGWLTSTVGRMEANLGGQRLVGAVDWTQQGQSFDGLRFDVETDGIDWVFLAFAVNDDTATGITSEEELYGAYGTVDDIGPGSLDVYWLYDRISGAFESDEHFLGARYVFGSDVTGRVEATYATGTRADTDVNAFMVGGRIGTAVAGGRLSATRITSSTASPISF